MVRDHLSASAIFRVPSAENDQFAKVVYFGVACSECLPIILCIKYAYLICFFLLLFFIPFFPNGNQIKLCT